MLNILDLVREKGIEPKRVSGHKGGEYHSPCPGCGGVDRFHIWPEQNNGEGSYWCRQCEKTGDAIQFLRDFDGLSFKEACDRLGKETSSSPQCQPLKIPGKNRCQVSGVGDQRTENIIPPDPWIEKAIALVSWAHEKLLPNTARMKYLRDRGLKRSTIIKYQFGWNPGKNGKDLWRPRESWGLPTELKNNRKKKLWIPRGLIIPLIVGGQVHRVRIRTLAKKPPYYVLPGSAMDTMTIRPNHRAYVVVESELDGILLDQEIGDLAGIVALGSSSTKPDPETYRSLQRSAVILVALDFDAAGAKAWQWWQEHFPQSERWPVPRGKDPGEAFQAGVDLAEWVRSGLPPGWRIGQSLLGSKKGEGREQVLRDRGQGSVETQHPKPNTQSEAIQELATILKEHPVAIHVAPDRIRIRETQKWVRENWETSKRLSELVFFTDEVIDFLHGHPERVITGENILK